MVLSTFYCQAPPPTSSVAAHHFTRLFGLEPCRYPAHLCRRDRGRLFNQRTTVAPIPDRAATSIDETSELWSARTCSSASSRWRRASADRSLCASSLICVFDSRDSVKVRQLCRGLRKSRRQPLSLLSVPLDLARASMKAAIAVFPHSFGSRTSLAFRQVEQVSFRRSS